MNLLVTGGAGFIGSNFIKYMIDKYNYTIVNLDLLTYAGNLSNLKEIEDNKNYTFIHGDILDKNLLRRIYTEHSIDIVVNFAAESHVDRSIEESDIFLKTNILGTQSLLEISKEYWYSENDGFRENVKFIQISTDEVYGSLGENGYFSEDNNILPSSPYSVSKASADMLVKSYHITYGLPMNITRCSNNYGPHQFLEKLIPLMINNAINDKSLPVYGDGRQVRDWIYVEDHCSAIDKVIHRGKNGEIYNIGGNCEKENIEIVRSILDKLNKPYDLIEHIADRLGHDRRYAIDNRKIKAELDWNPITSFEDGIKDTIKWYLDNTNWVDQIMNKDYLNYYKRMYGNK